MTGDTWETDRLPLVVYLRTQGYEPVDQEVVSNKCYFVFRSTPDLAAEIGKFETGQALVDPDKFSTVFQETLRQARGDAA